MPEDRKVERIGLEYRLEKARKRLEGVPVPPRPKIVHIRLQGKAVNNQTGIEARFAGRAAKAFSDSITTAAAGVTGKLQNTGPIRQADLPQLLISGMTSPASGFVIELPPSGESQNPEGPADRAMEMVQDILEAALTGDDTALREAAEQLHPRALRKLTEFMQLLMKNGAQTTIGFNRRDTAFRTPADIETAAKRLAALN